MSRKPEIEDRVAATIAPDQSPVMYQSWQELLFLHWIVPAEAIAETLPPGLHVDTYEGKAYLGLVPFLMRNIRPRFLPSVPWVSHFLEMNVRTYVYDDSGRPGVWFYSLDASQPVAVRVARRFFHLPYFDAAMSSKREGAVTDYQCHRRDAPGESRSHFTYQGDGPLLSPEPGTLEYFLLERYFLFAFAEKSRRLFCGQVHHSPYPAQEAKVSQFESGALLQAGFDIDKQPPDLLHYSAGVDVRVYPIFPIS